MIAIFDKDHILKMTASNVLEEDLVLKNGEYVMRPEQPIPEKPFESALSQYVFSANSWSWVDTVSAEDKLQIKWSLVRGDRNRLLQFSDWTQLPDVPLSTKEIWATYRQALRDITEQTDPFNIVWPTPPQ